MPLSCASLTHPQLAGVAAPARRASGRGRGAVLALALALGAGQALGDTPHTNTFPLSFGGAVRAFRNALVVTFDSGRPDTGPEPFFNRFFALDGSGGVEVWTAATSPRSHPTPLPRAVLEGLRPRAKLARTAPERRAPRRAADVHAMHGACAVRIHCMAVVVGHALGGGRGARPPAPPCAKLVSGRTWRVLPTAPLRGRRVSSRKDTCPVRTVSSPPADSACRGVRGAGAAAALHAVALLRPLPLVCPRSPPSELPSSPHPPPSRLQHPQTKYCFSQSLQPPGCSEPAPCRPVAGEERMRAASCDSALPLTLLAPQVPLLRCAVRAA